VGAESVPPFDRVEKDFVGSVIGRQELIDQSPPRLAVPIGIIEPDSSAPH
jgi:hypothetical protein